MSGLVVATTDSWLLHDSSARRRLTVLTLLVVCLFALVAGQAHRAGDDEEQFGGRWYRLPIAGVLAGVLGWLAGSGSLFVAALLLLAAIAVTVRFLLGRDPPLVLITVAGVAVGTTLSVYSGPVSAPRALGVMACAFIFVGRLNDSPGPVWQIDLRWMTRSRCPWCRSGSPLRSPARRRTRPASRSLAASQRSSSRRAGSLERRSHPTLGSEFSPDADGAPRPPSGRSAQPDPRRTSTSQRACRTPRTGASRARCCRR